jgi:hypothetical protein
MFETIVPFASKYNLLISTVFREDDTVTIVATIRASRGTVFVVLKASPSLKRLKT